MKSLKELYKNIEQVSKEDNSVAKDIVSDNIKQQNDQLKDYLSELVKIGEQEKKNNALTDEQINRREELVGLIQQMRLSVRYKDGSHYDTNEFSGDLKQLEEFDKIVSKRKKINLGYRGTGFYGAIEDTLSGQKEFDYLSSSIHAFDDIDAFDNSMIGQLIREYQELHEVMLKCMLVGKEVPSDVADRMKWFESLDANQLEEILPKLTELRDKIEIIEESDDNITAFKYEADDEYYDQKLEKLRNLIGLKEEYYSLGGIQDGGGQYELDRLKDAEKMFVTLKDGAKQVSSLKSELGKLFPEIDFTKSFKYDNIFRDLHEGHASFEQALERAKTVYEELNQQSKEQLETQQKVEASVEKVLSTTSSNVDKIANDRSQEQTTLVEDSSKELSKYKELLAIVEQVTQAVNAKTEAFRIEASVVGQAVQQEISSLNTLNTLLDEIKNSLQIVFDGNTKDFGDIHLGQDKINGESTSNLLQSIGATLSSIYGVLQGFTGVKADNENSAQYKPVNPEHQTGIQNLNDSAQALSSAADEIKQAQKSELVAMHGLSTKNLMKALEDGAFPSPSIAVTKPDVYSGGYGDATVVFKKSAIDPANNPLNKIYGVDAYTPTYPSFGYDLNETGLIEAAERTSIALDTLRNACDNDYESIRQAAEKLAYAAGLGTQFEEAFIKERGFAVNTVETDEQTKGRFHVDGENIHNAVRDIIARDGITFDDIIGNNDIKKEYLDAVDKYVSDYNSQFEDFPQAKIKDVVVSAFKDKLNAALSDKAIYDEEKAIFDHDQAVVRGELKIVDAGARANEIRRIINENQEEYVNYVEDVLKSAMVKPNVRGFNGQRFDRTADGIAAAISSYGGKNALYDEAPFMRRDMDDQLFIIGAAKNYKNFAEIEADAGRLQKDALGTHTKLDNDYIKGIARAVANANNIEQQDAFDKIVQAVDGNTTAESIGKALKNSGLAVDDATLNKLAASAQEAANVQTKYFEAKPQRALGLEDIEFVSVPKGASQLMSMLGQKGIKYVEHDADDALSRETALKTGVQQFGEENIANAQEQLQIEQKITAEKKQQEALEDSDNTDVTDVQREATEMTQLAAQVRDVETAVKSKTDAFTQEGVVVNQVIQQEIAALQSLINKLNEVKAAVNEKTDAFENEGGAVKEATEQQQSGQSKKKKATRKAPTKYKKKIL